jgi:hypothetical protein
VHTYTAVVISLGSLAARRALRLVAAVAVAAAVAVGGVGMASAFASPSATPTIGARAGYLVRPSHFSSARIEFRVPAAHCAADGAATGVEIGIFGKTRYSRDTIPWFASVTSSCRAGRSRYFADFGDFTGVEPRTVHRGDLIRISAKGGNGPRFTIRDLTTGRRLDGGATPPPGEITVPRVVLGGRRIGVTATHRRVAITRCTVNAKPMSASPHRRAVQQHRRKIIAHPTSLSAHGTVFTLAVS